MKMPDGEQTGLVASGADGSGAAGRMERRRARWRPWLSFSLAVLAIVVVAGSSPAAQRAAQTLDPLDVFELEWVSDPRISPDGERVVYVRNFNDIMADTGRSNLWIVGWDGEGPRPLTTGNANDGSPRWSPDGSRLLYTSNREGGVELWMRWMDTGQTARLTRLQRSPGSLAWSPDGEWIAFTMFVPDRGNPLDVDLPSPPEGADWAEPARVITQMNYRADGAGYLDQGSTHVFLLPAEGGTPRQLTEGDFDHNGPLTWTPDGSALLFSANRDEGWEYDPNDTELWAYDFDDAVLEQLTDRHGPDNAPAVAPDSSLLAWTGFEERYQGYQVTELWVKERGGEPRSLTAGLDRSVQGHVWKGDSSGLYFQYDDEGNTKIAFVDLDGRITELADDVGGLSIGRPYSGGQFTVSPQGRFAFTMGRPSHPADLAVGSEGPGDVRRLTRLNADLFGHRELAEVEEIWWESSHDGRPIQGWLAKPPGFDPSRRYPLLLEIHGGPFANYGDRFSAEVQLYAAEGYVVLYANPRGSTSYGEEFGNLIHHAYPSQDYDDLMSGVDAVIERGWVDEENLFVTGGSGGGVLSAWIVGHTDRFAAAVVAKPVINWYSFVLTADLPALFYKYWFPGLPWDHLDHYMERSPLHHVGNVTTPTMLLTGEVDYRTPISETEQFYTALQLVGVDTAMVRIPEASHGIAARPSYLISKVEHVLAWFDRYRDGGGEEGSS